MPPSLFPDVPLMDQWQDQVTPGPKPMPTKMTTLTACGGGTPHLGCEGRIAGLPDCNPGRTAAIGELHDLRDALQVSAAL